MEMVGREYSLYFMCEKLKAWRIEVLTLQY